MVKSIRYTKTSIFSLFLFLALCFSICAQDDILSKEFGEITSTSVSAPFAVPVLSQEEALKINKIAIKEYESRIAKHSRKQILNFLVKCLKYILAGLLIIAYLLIMSRLTNSAERAQLH
jgi:hypothetical protein